MKRGILYIMIGLIMNSLDPEKVDVSNDYTEHFSTCGDRVLFSVKKHHYLDGNCNLVRDWINCAGPKDFIALHFPFDPLAF